MTERRSNRSKSHINYSKFEEVDDDDFADPTPPNKKSSTSEKENKAEKPKVTSVSNDKNKTRRKPEDRLLKRQLKEAIAASLSGSPNNNSDDCQTDTQNTAKEKKVDKAESTREPDDDEIEFISSEIVKDSPARKRQRKETKHAIIDSDSEEDKDSTFALDDRSEDDDDFDPDEDDCEDLQNPKKRKITVLKTTKSNLTSKNVTPIVASKEKTPKHGSKTMNLTGSNSPLQSTSTPKSSRISVLARTPASAGSKVPVWTPPGPASGRGNSDTSSCMKSPSGGIRLGLSRNQRVKTLHPSLTVQH